MGLDYETKDDLITDGFYQYVRNPYFLFLLGFQFSLFFIVPNAIVIGSFIQSLILINLQVRYEEIFLGEKYEQQYSQYKNETNRFLPIIRSK